MDRGRKKQVAGRVEISFMGKRVLTIDDSKTMRAIIAKYLSPFSIKVLEAENGEQGVDLARETLDALRQYAEIASLPKDLSLQYSLNSMK